MRQDVVEGLTRPQKELSPKYFYDAHGSQLFERITELAEYYPTRTERSLLTRWMPDWVDELRPAGLVELGAGSAAKSRVILDAMQANGGSLYVPVDVSGDFLEETARRLRAEYADLEVEPAVADISEPMELPVEPPTPTWYALLGSTIGNFDQASACDLLDRIAGRLGPEDRFLMGADLRPGRCKTRETLEAAYNDGEGVTAAFNLNVLRVLNRELGADFELDAFHHRAEYVPEASRVEMHLVAERPQTVRIPQGPEIAFDEGESIRTEISRKYDRTSVDRLFESVGMEVERWQEDGDGYFALMLGRRAS